MNGTGPAGPAWTSLGGGHLDRYERHGAEPDLRRAEDALARAVASAGTAGERGDAMILLGRALAHRYDVGQDPEHLRRAHETLVAGLRELEGLDGFAEQARSGRLRLAFVAAHRQSAEEDEDRRAALTEAALPSLERALADQRDRDDPEGAAVVAQLHAHLADLCYERGCRTGDSADLLDAAGHFRALLDARLPGADAPTQRYLLARSLMLHALVTTEGEHLAAARHEFDLVLEDAAAEGEEPWWVPDARVRRAYLRAGQGLRHRDARQLALAVTEVEQLLAEDNALLDIPAVYLELFAHLLYERAAADDDEAGRERALRLLRHVVDSWDVSRDGTTVWKPAALLTALQQQRYLGDRDPARLDDVVAGAERAMTCTDLDPDMSNTCRAALLWARQEQVGLGLISKDAFEAAAQGEAMATMRAFMDMFSEGRAFFDFSEQDEHGATGTDLAYDGGRTAAMFDRMYAHWAAHEGEEGYADSAVYLLGVLFRFDSKGGHVSEERRRALIGAAVGATGKDDAWRARAHLAAGAARFSEGITGGAYPLDEVRHHLDRARELGASGPDLLLLEMQEATQRGRLFGGRDDLEAGLRAADELFAAGELNPYLNRLVTAEAAVMAGGAAVRRGDLPAVDRAVGRLAEVVAELAEDDPSRVDLWVALENLALEREGLARALGEPSEPSPADRRSEAEVRRGAAMFPRGHRSWVLGATGIVRSARALAREDADGLTDACGLLEEAIELAGDNADAWLRYTGALGVNYCALADLEPSSSRRAERLTRAIALLEEAARAAAGPAHPAWASASAALGSAYRARDADGDRSRGRRAGLGGLRGLTWSTLLQAGTEHAADVAREATAGALQVAAWCLADGVPAEAVRALDACRGLVLHSALTSASVPESLEAAGRTDLVREWRDAGASTAGPGSDLRRRVFEVLTGDGGEPSTRQALLDPPEPEEIARALRATGADALVYLMPATADGGGAAVIVTAHARVGSMPLPRLSEQAAPLRAYGPAGGGARDLGPLTAAPPGPTLRRQLDRLCSWAWYAAMDPLLDALAPEVAGGRPPKLVLVPMGALSVVPWHAAWGPAGEGGRRYAVEAAEISYAASARLLCEVAARAPAPPGDAALIVGNPTGDLRHAGEEADAVQRVLYPAGRFLGRRAGGASAGPGTPAEVLAWLRGAGSAGAVLHLACHGTVTERARRSAHLSLDGGELAAEELTEAHGAGPAGVGLVVLAACRSHVSGRGHNEAYSLSTAFLVAGARSVVGSLWPVPDDATSVLMFMTHWFLRREGEPPGRALRRAQLWMLDPAREIPQTMPAALAARARAGDTHDLTAWAGFTHLGW
ncbi:CHAT domain-containing protein [Streptomyces johnsoniae]|uniref:CHAT domain-containing protein n=1 Tax=Streptomyces johnsoniae TaxID=3075532 RepID=A0ABU2S8X0_9ACTN|nr:CHAT domain-containing protein [Streptomyces sp. DSM 41886]MDT0445433.1 CHAT domain-containing protein [Streptomyces sp. DSM 41886]